MSPIFRTRRSISMSPRDSRRCSSSKLWSKWSSIARFWLLVTMMTCSMPAATASSTAYWMTGLSTSGSISFGCALVAGRNRVPQPAAGKTALRTRIEPPSTGLAGAPWVVRCEWGPSIRPGRVGRPCRDRCGDPRGSSLYSAFAGLGSASVPSAGTRGESVASVAPASTSSASDELERRRALPEEERRERDADDGLEEHEDRAAHRPDRAVAGDEGDGRDRGAELTPRRGRAPTPPAASRPATSAVRVAREHDDRDDEHDVDAERRPADERRGLERRHRPEAPSGHERVDALARRGDQRERDADAIDLERAALELRCHDHEDHPGRDEHDRGDPVEREALTVEPGRGDRDRGRVGVEDHERQGDRHPLEREEERHGRPGREEAQCRELEAVDGAGSPATG